MPLLESDLAINNMSVIPSPAIPIAGGVVYQLSTSHNISEVIALRSPEDSQKLTLYHTAQVANARTDDMYFDRLMCE